jgi:hypothetical protein
MILVHSTTPPVYAVYPVQFRVRVYIYIPLQEAR